jgi:hypothetical protein
MNEWWKNLSNTERALILGGGFAISSAVVMGIIASRGLQAGLPITVEVGPETRGIVAQGVRQTNTTLDRISTRGVPVYLLFGKRDLSERRN